MYVYMTYYRMDMVQQQRGNMRGAVCCVYFVTLFYLSIASRASTAKSSTVDVSVEKRKRKTGAWLVLALASFSCKCRHLRVEFIAERSYM
jgi:hypothetical protein